MRKFLLELEKQVIMYDVVIIGSGPAGISASLYTKRANLKTLILYQGKSDLEKTNQIENYYGFENGVNGKELYKIGINQAKNIGVDVKKQEVTSIQMMEKGFVVKTSDSEYKSKTVILATGNKKNQPQIHNIEKFEGRGISYCAICDGFFYRNKNVSVIGNGDYAISEVNDLVNLAKKITILTNGEKPPELRNDDLNVEINTQEIEAIQGDTKVEQIQFKDGTTLKTEGIFIAVRNCWKFRICKKVGNYYSVLTNLKENE